MKNNAKQILPSVNHAKASLIFSKPWERRPCLFPRFGSLVAALCSRHMAVAFLLIAVQSFCGNVSAQDFNNLEYLCCDWGPAMTLPTKPNEAAQFNDTEDEVYFLKQATSFTRRKRLGKDLFSGRDYEDIGKGLSIYLCKMRADGSAKTEIKELWKNPAYPIDTQGQSTWMDVNRKTHKIVFSITFAGSDITGLWTVDLDGRGLKRVITPDRNAKYLQAINHPSWTPDGEWIFYEEELRGMNPNRFNIGKCDVRGSGCSRIFEATEKIQYQHPCVSPDGKKLAFLRLPYGYPGAPFVWIANLGGTTAAPVGGKETIQNCGSAPAWSPDGKQIFLRGRVLDAQCGDILRSGTPLRDGKAHSEGWVHWGRFGFIGFNLSGILFTDKELKNSKLIGVPRLVEKGGTTCAW